MRIIFYSKVKTVNHKTFYQMLHSLLNRDETVITFYLDSWFEDKLPDVVNLRNLNFIRRFKEINNNNALIFEPTASLVSVLSFLLFIRIKTIMVLHNANNWLLPPSKLTLKNLLKYFFRQLVIRKTDSFIVVDPNIRDYIKSLNLYNKRIFFVPFADPRSNDANKRKLSNEYMVFTIPGMVDNQRRDYRMILTVFKRIIDTGHKVRLILLGRINMDDNELMNELIHFEKNYSNNIEIFRDYISDSLFNDKLIQSDYLIGNLNVTFEDDYTFERYGTTKASGILFLMLRYLKRTFLPYDYILPQEVEKLAIRYSSHLDLENKIIMSLRETQIKDPDLKSIQTFYGDRLDQECKDILGFIKA